MRIGVPREIKVHEYRVGATPACVRAYREAGHEVWVERDAGTGAGFEDADYESVGARLVDTPEEIYATAELVVKVKEPMPAEYDLLRRGQILFTYLHLAANTELVDALLRSGASAVAYETIELEDGSLPCLIPMSEIAGRLATQQGAKYLERPMGGRGVLLGGVPGVARGQVAVLGGGTAGTQAAKMAVGLGARVTILDVSAKRLGQLDDLFGVQVDTRFANASNLERAVTGADLVIGAVLKPGAAAPKLVPRSWVARMQPGSVIVDVAVDQGGCVETTRPTTHDAPVYQVDGVQHYCVTNMPSAVSRTATVALTSTTLPYGLALANLGLDRAMTELRALRSGLNVRAGNITHPAVAAAWRRSIPAPSA